MSLLPKRKGKQNVLPERIEKKLNTITDFLLSMPPADRNAFVNKYVAPTVGEAIGEHYKMLVQMESAEVEAALQTKRSQEISQQARNAIPEVMRTIGEALLEIDDVYNGITFSPDSPTREIWEIVRVIASTKVINVSYSAYDGRGEAFEEALDVIETLMQRYKRQVLPPSLTE